MSAPNTHGQARAGLARLIAAGVAYAATAALLRVVIHLVFSPFAGSHSYRVGLLLGLPTAILVGSVAGLIVAASQRRLATFAWFVLQMVLLSGVAVAAHYHTIFNALPDRGLLHFVDDPAMRGSFSAALPSWVLAAELGAAGLVSWLLYRRLRTSKVLMRFAPAILAVIVALGGIVPLLVPLSSGQLAIGRAEPWIWLATYSRSGETAVQWEGTTAEAYALVAAEMGFAALGDVDGPYPLCVDRRETSRPRRDRDVIFLMFEGLTARELTLEHNGVAVCPNIAAAFRGGTTFTSMYANAAQSSAVLESIVAGLPANPNQIMLQHAPVPHVEGFPQHFADAGYTTAYFHGADLSFENKRPFMAAAGFQLLAEPQMERGDLPAGSWGEHDAQTYARLQAWITERASAGERFFAAMTTLSTHHPYVVPPEHPPIDPGSSEFARFVNAYNYMDTAFAEFLNWYQTFELPRGTLLVIVGEHSPRLAYPTDSVDTTTGMFEFRFGLPFAVLGLTDDEEVAARAMLDRPAGQYDLGPTLLGLVGLSPPNCSVGRDLLADDATFSPTRTIASHAGHIPYFLYFHRGDIRWMYDFHAGRLRAYNLRLDPLLRNDIASIHADRAFIHQLLAAYLVVMRHLDELGDRAPRSEGSRVSALPPPSWPPRIVSPIDPRRAGVSYGHGAVRWAASQSTATNLQALAFATSDGELILSSSATVSGQAGDDYIARFDLASIRSRVDVEVARASDFVSSLPAGSLVVFDLGTQFDVRFELIAVNALAPVVQAGRARGVAVEVRTNSMTVANAAAVYPETPFWLEPPPGQVLDARFTDFCRGLGIDGLVFPPTAPVQAAEATRAAGLRVAVEGAAAEQVSTLEPLLPHMVVTTP